MRRYRSHLLEKELVVEVLSLLFGQVRTRMKHEILGMQEAKVLSADSTASIATNESRTTARGDIAGPMRHGASMLLVKVQVQ